MLVRRRPTISAIKSNAIRGLERFHPWVGLVNKQQVRGRSHQHMPSIIVYPRLLLLSLCIRHDAWKDPTRRVTQGAMQIEKKPRVVKQTMEWFWVLKIDPPLYQSNACLELIHKRCSYHNQRIFLAAFFLFAAWDDNFRRDLLPSKLNGQQMLPVRWWWQETSKLCHYGEVYDRLW